MAHNEQVFKMTPEREMAKLLAKEWLDGRLSLETAASALIIFFTFAFISDPSQFFTFFGSIVTFTFVYVVVKFSKITERKRLASDTLNIVNMTGSINRIKKIYEDKLETIVAKLKAYEESINVLKQQNASLKTQLDETNSFASIIRGANNDSK
jgi:cell shape-determining protein MreC